MTAPSAARCAGEVRPRKTIWQKLAERLGREPTHREACDEVYRILAEAGLAGAEVEPVEVGRG